MRINKTNISNIKINGNTIKLGKLNGTLDCFINGTKYANVITGWQAITDITSSTLFAKYSANSQYFYGAVKQLRIYDKALTDEEVQQNYEYCTNN